jgi:Acetyltransferase (GNAT) family
MPLEILPLVESDTDKWASLFYPAFKDQAVGCLWRREPGPETITLMSSKLREGITYPNVYTFKVVDTDLPTDNQIIAVANWSVYEHERPIEEVEKGYSVGQTVTEANREARVEFMEGIFKIRREVLGGKPHVMLNTLLCDPSQRRRGAGKMLMQWGIKKSEELGIVAYLEASSMGKPLYTLLGYKSVGETVFDATKYGAKTEDVHTVSLTCFCQNHAKQLYIVYDERT